MALTDLRASLGALKDRLYATVEYTREAQVVMEKLIEAEMWLVRCHDKPPPPPRADPSENTPIEGLGPVRRSGEWPVTR